VKDEPDLIQSALSGNSEAFGVLVERYQDRLYSCVVNVVNQPDEAEDVVQESFIQAYLKLDTFQQSSQFFTWLYRIAFNNALSRRRRHRHQLSLDQAQEVSGSEPTARNEAPDFQIIQRENIGQLRGALDKLSADHRSILVLRELEDTSYEDIAEILDISIGTVRSRLSRARAALKSQLEILTDYRPSPEEP
jgi:RNA polymerase sigma-70 factor (ECF subfamily)